MRPKMPQASHKMTLIKFFDWMRGIFTMEPKMDEEVIMMPLSNKVNTVSIKVKIDVVNELIIVTSDVTPPSMRS